MAADHSPHASAAGATARPAAMRTHHSAEPVRAPRPTLDELADRIAIRELTALYNNAWLVGDPDAWADTFTEDGVFAIANGPTLEGRAALREMLIGAGGGGLHLTMDAVIQVEGARATQQCQVVNAAPLGESGEYGISGFGSYRDDLVRTPDGWRFARRSFASHAVRDGDQP